jgi:TPR repeat protein
MNENFAEMLSVGGKSNSLGRVNDVISLVQNDRSRLDDLYRCLFFEDAWVRMRAADALEKICREHPDWLLAYLDRFPKDLASSNQPSIQWHLAQIYGEVTLTPEQKAFAIDWLKRLLATVEVDWIVSANAMDTLAQFARDGSVPKSELRKLVKIQQKHKSKSVVRRASKLLESL